MTKKENARIIAKAIVTFPYKLSEKFKMN